MDLKDHCILHTFIRKHSGKNWYLSVRNWVKASQAAEDCSTSFPPCLAEAE